MNRIQLLDELQRVDLQIEESQRLRRQLEDRLEDDALLTAARQRLSGAQQQEKESRARLRALELEGDTLDEHIKGVDTRLYGGKVGNPKELAGLERDEAMLKRQKQELEDRMLDEMARLEAAQEFSARKTVEVEAAKKVRESEQIEDRAKLERLLAGISRLEKQRADMIPQIAPADLKVYDGLLHAKKGRAVSHLKGTACSACGFAVPSGVASRARVGDELAFCVNCGRILVA